MPQPASPASPGQLLAICLLPRLFAFMHFNDATISSPNLYILHLYRIMLLEVSFIPELWNRKWRYVLQQLQFTQSSNWGAFTTLNSTPPSPNFRFMGSFFCASDNKPALNTNAHFQCIWHFQTAWIENLGKMLQWSNCRRNTLLFLLLIRNKTQVRPYCRLISY